MIGDPPKSDPVTPLARGPQGASAHSGAALNRRIEITTKRTELDRLEARSVVEDDFHHFRVRIRAVNGAVSEVFSEALRNPNTLCPSAGQRLSELIGMPLNEACSAVSRVADPRQQCTHQFDLAGLAVAALAQGRRRRIYEAVIPDRVSGRTVAILRRDGEEVLSWTLQDQTITDPAPYSGHGIGTGFSAFATSLPLEQAEAALVLRRAVFISQGRGVDVDRLGLNGPVGGCWAWQPERMRTLQRLPEARRDFTGQTQKLGSLDQDWLRFESDC